MKTKFYIRFGVLIFLVGLTFQLYAQDVQIRGQIMDENNEPIPGVSVLVKGTATGVASDIDGSYSISAPSTGTLLFSFIGYETQEISVGNRSIINVSLKLDLSDLEEVVVVGYGTVRKSQLTGAIASVSSREINELPITDARQALQGRASGVDVTQAGSKPGSSPQVRIRGRRSFNAGNDPLYVVDNIPIVGGLTDFNSQDIASMEVLKDASATAIYGSRGANGVVLITTKRGETGRTRISWDSYYGLNTSLGRIENFNGEEFADYKRESRRASGEYPEGPNNPEADEAIFEPNELESIRLGRSFDYIDALTRRGSIQSHNLSVGGGNEKTTFFVSGNFFKDVGVVKSQDFSRYTLRINIDHKINDKVRIGTSTLGTYSERNGENFNPIGGALQENPLGRTFNDDGSINFQPTQDGLRTNPLAEIVPGAHGDLTKRYRIFNSLYGVWDIAPGLSYRVNFGPDVAIRRSGRFIGRWTNNRRGGDPTGSINEDFSFNYTLENIVNYTRTLGQDHTFAFTGLQSLQRDNFESSAINVLGIPVETQLWHRLNDASQITSASTNLVQWTLFSYMGRLNYDYKGKYMATVTMRADGSSRFGENNRFGYFPSLALGWNISDEQFMQNSSFIDQMKLRASYGSIGNQGISPYQTQPLLTRTAYAFGDNAAFGYMPGTIGNPDLKWESSTTANVGLDFSFVQGRIAGTLEYYVTTTSDLLAPQPLPNSTGFGGFTTNVGKTQNRGLELSLTTINIDKGGFRWSTDFTLTRNREEILDLANGDDVGAGRFIGHPISVFFDWKKIGIWQTDQKDLAESFADRVGEIRIEDLDGNGRITADDRQILGSPVPDFSGGITNRFSYKGVDFSFFLFGRVGSMIRSAFHTGGFNALAGRYNNLAVNYWTPNNPTDEYPRPHQNQEFPKYSSSLQYFDGTFLKVRNINLGYTLPVHIASKLGMESLKIYSSVQQPFIFSEYRTVHKGIDPETFVDTEQGVDGGTINANITPAVTQYTFGINARF